MKHLVTRLLLLAVLPVVARADDFTIITNLDNTITITKYTGAGGNVEILAEIDGLPVTIVGESAFEDVTSVTSVTILDSVTNIENYAFYNCSGLTNVTIGNNVSFIGDKAFSFCTSLTGITIPASVAAIGQNVFLDCSSLTAITVDAANSFYSSADGFLIDKVNSRLIQCPEGKVGGVTVPDGVTVIENEAFAYCSGLTQVTIPASVTNIGDYAFWSCTGLAVLYFQGNAPSLGDDIFFNVFATVYYLAGTDGWGTTYGGLTTQMMGSPQIELWIVNPGFSETNGFGFTVTGSTGAVVVVEASTNLTGGGWQALQTNTLSDGSFYFSDQTNYSRRFYRLLNREPSSL
jgi:hypothetical protein